ncbi:hypothetical protein IFM89_030309 [Coptis chinensis]|uniref:Uncharacterized protein n=1 Tax=Coptis chinensis TaxID=261450 RepID=A0A835IQS4_9MAGN|nr:hypothetical protein IFM89_025969 [Coptis chinensis]KAF9622267.1 hypothetical protein IFM89_030309 [Coptis chinensis]
MAMKWKKIAGIGRKRISVPRPVVDFDAEKSSKSVASKGHFVVYTYDEKRYMIPLAYLTNNIFRELLQMAEEEFGLPSNGPIRLPCDAILMDYIVLLVQRGVSDDMEKALVISLASGRCSVSPSLTRAQSSHHQCLIQGF